MKKSDQDLIEKMISVNSQYDAYKDNVAECYRSNGISFVNHIFNYRDFFDRVHHLWKNKDHESEMFGIGSGYGEDFDSRGYMMEMGDHNHYSTSADRNSLLCFVDIFDRAYDGI